MDFSLGIRPSLAFASCVVCVQINIPSSTLFYIWGIKFRIPSLLNSTPSNINTTLFWGPKYDMISLS